MGVRPLSIKLPLASFINKVFAGADDFLAKVVSIFVELYNLSRAELVSTMSLFIKPLVLPVAA